MSLPTFTGYLLTWLFLIGRTTQALSQENSPGYDWRIDEAAFSGSGMAPERKVSESESYNTALPPAQTHPNVSFNLTWHTSFPQLLKSYRVEYRQPVDDASTPSAHSISLPGWSVAATLPPSSTSYALELPKGPNYQFRVVATLKENGEEIFIINTADEDSCKCEADWVRRQGSCYRSFYGLKPWDEAAKCCQKENAHLVIIESEEENSFVNKVLRDSTATTAWIGLNDRKKEGSFVWMNGKSLRRCPFPAWDAGEPNDAQRREDCVELFNKFFRSRSSHQGVWNDQSCTTTRPGYICEIDGQPPTSQTKATAIPKLVYTISWLSPFPLSSFSVEHRRIFRNDQQVDVFGPWVVDAAVLPPHRTSYTVSLDPATYEFRVNGSLIGVSEPVELLRHVISSKDILSDSRMDSRPPNADIALWRWHNGSYYRHFSSSQGVTWYQANISCTRRGAHLVVITSEQENSFVNSLADSAFNQASRKSWIGLSDLAEEGQFVWVSGEDLLLPDATRCPYSNWDSREPNNKHTFGEDCAAMWSSGTWNDFYCYYKNVNYLNGYICEKDARVGMNADNVNIMLKEPAPVRLARGLYEVGQLCHDLLIERYDTQGKFTRYGFVENVTYPLEVALYSRGGFYQLHQLVHTSAGINYTLASSIFPPIRVQDCVGTPVPFILNGISVKPRTSRQKFALRILFPQSTNSSHSFRKPDEQASWEVCYRKLGNSEVLHIIIPFFRTRLTIPNLMFGNYEVQVTAKNHNSGQQSTTFTTIVSGLCGSQWTWQNGKCYCLHFPLSWQTAKSVCNIQGGKLIKTYNEETKAVLSRVTTDGVSGVKVATVWAEEKSDAELCYVRNISSGVIEQLSCREKHHFMCERDDLSVHPTPEPGSQMVFINEPLVGVPSHWPEATPHLIVIEKFNPQEHHFEDYMTVTGFTYPYNVHLEHGFFQVSHIGIAKRGARPPIQYTLKRSTVSVQYTGEQPFEITAVKAVRQLGQSTTQISEQRPPVAWTVQLPLLPQKYASTYNQWRIVYSGNRMDYHGYQHWEKKQLVPVVAGTAQTVVLQAVPDYGMAVDVTAVGNNGQESTTFTMFVA